MGQVEADGASPRGSLGRSGPSVLRARLSQILVHTDSPTPAMGRLEGIETDVIVETFVVSLMPVILGTLSVAETGIHQRDDQGS